MTLAVSELQANNPYIKRLPGYLKKNPDSLISACYKQITSGIEGGLYAGVPLSCIMGALDYVPFAWGFVIGIGSGLSVRGVSEIYHQTRVSYSQDWKNWLQRPSAMKTPVIIIYFLSKLAVITAIFIANFKWDNLLLHFAQGAIVGYLFGSEILGITHNFFRDQDQSERVNLL